MKVYEYTSLYGLIYNSDYYVKINGELIEINELLEEFPDKEMTTDLQSDLDFLDRMSLSKTLKDDYFTPANVIPYLREMFDTYRESGGKPLEWLRITLESVILNPKNYKAELRATLEKNLLEWIEIFEKLPFDYLYHNTTRELSDENITSNYWFKVGLLFANGEMDKLKLEFKSNSTKIAKHLGNINYRPYISESISKTNLTDKNIFSSQDKLHHIKEYCDMNDIEVTEDFLRFIKFS